MKIKKILIIESCQSCPVRRYDHPNNCFICSEENLTTPYFIKGFPTWCPLDNLPIKLSEGKMTFTEWLKEEKNLKPEDLSGPEADYLYEEYDRQGYANDDEY